MALTDKEQRFCEEYLVDLNATQAAIRAGYSEKTARSIGSENLSKPDIQEKISLLRQELSDKTGITAQRVLNELAKIAFSDLRKAFKADNALLDVRQFDDDIAGAVASVEVDALYEKIDGEKELVGQTQKIKLYDKVAALEKLGKHLGIFEKDNRQKRLTINLPDWFNGDV